MFAPSVFSRSPKDGAHIVHKQPSTPNEVDESRAALSACPVAAIRVETNANRHHRKQEPLTSIEQELCGHLALNPKFNGLELPFPRRVSSSVDVYFVGHHNSKSFGAAPYLFQSSKGWILVDTPKYSKLAVKTIETLTGPGGPSFLILTHIDDTAGHNDWKEHYPNLRRVFHSGDLGRHNWIGDKSLEHVEILLENTSDRSKKEDYSLHFFAMDGSKIMKDDDVDDDVSIVHTPGHSPGSISVLWKPKGVLFTGDTYSYTTRWGGRMTGFPRYGNDQKLQSKILPQLLKLDWKVIAPGHGHVRDYTHIEDENRLAAIRRDEMEAAIQELLTY